MTSVTFYSDDSGLLTGFRAGGHSGYAQAGEDIVCAAVSALCQSVEYGLSEVIRIPVVLKKDDRKGLLSVHIQPEADAGAMEKSQVLLQTLKGSLQAIAEDYPRNVRITVERTDPVRR